MNTMTCGCTAGSPPTIPYQGGGGKRRKRTKKAHKRKPNTRRRKAKNSFKKKRKMCGGNYLTGTIADGSDGTALGNMIGSQRAGGSWEINQDTISQPFSKL